VDDRVEALEVGRLDVAHVAVNARHRDGLAAEGAAREEADVQAVDLMARLEQHRDEQRADVAVVSGN
jgi:hypothetical protein